MPRLTVLLVAVVALGACSERSPTSSVAVRAGGPLLTSATNHGVTIETENVNPWTPTFYLTPPYARNECDVSVHWTNTLSVNGHWVSGTIWTQPAEDPFAALVRTDYTKAQVEAVMEDTVMAAHLNYGGLFRVTAPDLSGQDGNDFLVRVRMRWKTDAVRVDSATTSGFCTWYSPGDPIDTTGSGHL